MSATGLEVFDKTLQTTNSWLDEISEARPRPKARVEGAFGPAAQLRDRMSVDPSAHLGAELPLLVRGVYYDQFEPPKQPTDWDLDRFTEEIAEWLSGVRSVNPRKAIRAVFSVLSRHAPRGQIAKVQQALPQDMRASWISAEERIIPPPEKGELGRYRA